MIKIIFIRFAIVVGIVLISGITFAQGGDETALQSLEKPYQVVSDPLQWAETISLVLAISALILIIVTVLLERMHIHIPYANLHRFIYLFILPIFIFAFGSFATFEGSTKVEFCGSCHSAMGIYVDDMKDKDSNTLAAIHYQNRYLQHGQCYQCHAGYRVVDIGTAKGKGLLHLYYWITNSPTGSGEKQIRLYDEGGYPNSLCLRCHSGSKAFLEAGEGVHKKAADYLIEDPDTETSKMSCLKCHGPAHLSLAEWKAPKIFTGRGLVSGQQGMNIFPADKPGKSRNLDRPYEGAPPTIPHNIMEYKITRNTNTCLNECHIKGLDMVPASHFVNEYTEEHNNDRLERGRYNCLQCHTPQAVEEPIISHMEHFKITATSQSYIKHFLLPEKEIYQGVGMCEFCHSMAKIGNQYGKWKRTSHSRAYIDLSSEKGKDIAKQMGETGNPQKSDKCLPCHSTGYNSNGKRDIMFKIEDGIQCEQCHGAGNGYIKLNTMKMLSKDEINKEMVGQLNPDKELCMTCHEPKHEHILPFEEKERFKKIAH